MLDLNSIMRNLWIFCLLMVLAISRAAVDDNEVIAQEETIELEMLDLLGLTEQTKHITRKSPAIRNSASKFLLEVYNQLQSEEYHYADTAKRHKRSSMRDNVEQNFITQLDRWEIENCNDIITFASKPSSSHSKEKLALNFNTNDVPRELHLVHAALRMYQDPSLGIYAAKSILPITISVYKRWHNRKQDTYEYRVLTSLNTTTHHKGWLELNVTHVLHNWLAYKSSQEVSHGHDIYIEATLTHATSIGRTLNALNTGIVPPFTASDGIKQNVDLQPFIIGYFNGPELLVKMQKLRFKRELIRRKRRADQFPRPPPVHVENELQLKPCERLNFTLEFRDLELHKTIIAPKKFEAFFCGGQCNFPLGAKMNATNHAIVQTLMHLKKPHLPKPCCVPTVLGSISILYYLNDDSVNLKKIPQSVAKECGCH